MIDLMIMSLGGSPEPLKKSIDEHNPKCIIFLASHDSIQISCDIITAQVQQPKVIYEITEDPNSMFECYKAARRCVERQSRMGFEAENVVVDYTGGTKVMTAGLILATIGEPYRFNYVGGEQRNKGGLGTVINGSEKMYAEMSPWSIFAEEERRQVISLFNLHRYSSVARIIDSLLQKELPVEIEGYFAFVKPLADGFLCWEQFRHKDAVKHLKDGIAELRRYMHLYGSTELNDFSSSLDISKNFLNELVNSTKGITIMHSVLVDDLLNNARRRLRDERFDDASARIYRALELHGQIRFSQVIGCTNDKVPADKIPASIRHEFSRKYMDPKSRKLKLPLQATFQVLHMLGDESGKKFFTKQEEIRNIQSSRNFSILAHGINPVSKYTAESIFKTVAEFVDFKDVLDFPSLPQ
ncbi:MAG TPA: TIGR02710 family CRISPR-associated protein [Deltaproteobacteria bacterium]|mgnify:CR=1 FL=1|nr:TIGR02710 family CRISPR-associated protein [Deltaproteobacteria bacterium]